MFETLQPLIRKLESESGLDLSSKNFTYLESLFEERKNTLQLKTLLDYILYTLQSKEEQEILIDRLLIPESWFFRDKIIFTYLKQWIKTYQYQNLLRILLAPCAAGQEAYSLAITLAKADVNPESFIIQGVDLSPQMIQQARSGVYRKIAFRGNSLKENTQWFEPIDEQTWKIKDKLKQSVYFKRVNLAKTKFFENQLPFDIIFCRNLFIYFHKKAKEELEINLHKVLKKEGLLFIGHADRINKDLWRPVKDGVPFCFKSILEVKNNSKTTRSF